MYAKCETILKGFIAAVPKTFASVSAECQSTSRVTVEASGDNLSSVVAQAAAHEGQIGSQAGLIYTALQSIAKNRYMLRNTTFVAHLLHGGDDLHCVCIRASQSVPLTPLRKPGHKAKGTTAVPFLSTPVSVKKARLYTQIILYYTYSICSKGLSSRCPCMYIHVHVHVLLLFRFSVLLWQN